MHDIVGASVPERGCYPGLGSVPHCCVTKERPAERKGETSLAAPSHAPPLIRKLESIFPLSEDERTALENLPIEVANLEADQDVVRIGERPSRCFLLQTGSPALTRSPARARDRSSTSTSRATSLTSRACTSRFSTTASSRSLRAPSGSSRTRPCTTYAGAIYRITRALWRETLVDVSVFREWIVNNGR